MVSVSSFSYSKAKDVYFAILSKTTAFLLMFIPSAIRYGIGTDYAQYARGFGRISVGYPTRAEPGFVAINKLSGFLNLGAQGVFAITAFLTFLFLFLAVPKKYFYIIIPVFFCMFYAASFNIIRNVLAFTIAYYACCLFLRAKNCMPLVLILLGSLFHTSVLLFYPLFGLMFVKINKWQAVIFFLLSSATVYFFGSQIINWVLDSLFTGTQFARYTIYRNTVYILASDNSSFFLFAQLLATAFVLFLMPNDKNRTISRIFVFLLVANFAYLMGSASLIFHRVYTVFSIVWLIVLQYISNRRYRFRTILLMFIFCWTFGSFLLAVGFMGSSDIIPYRTIFD